MPVRSFFRHCLLLSLALGLTMASGANAQEKVRLQLKWLHQFQFAGYYAAQAQGYYKEAGLEVEMIPLVPGGDAVREVLDGRAEYGVGSTDLLLRRAQGAPVVVLGVVFQHSPMALMVAQRPGLDSIHDLAGRKVMMEADSAELSAYLRREGLDEKRLNLQPHSYTAYDLALGRVDAMSVYVTDEPFELVRQQHDYVLYSPRSAGIDFYGDNLFTTEKELRENPDRVRRFREASLKGWAYAMNHVDEMVLLIQQQYTSRHSPEHLRFEARQMVPLIQSDLIAPGHMYEGRWRHIADVYAELGMLPKAVSLKGFLYRPEGDQTDRQRWYLLVALLAAVGGLAGAIAWIMLRANRRLRGSEQRFQALFQALPIAYIVSDREGRIRQWNRAATQMFGWHEEIALGQSITELLVPPSAQSSVAEALGRVLGGEGDSTLVNLNRHRDGHEFICEWRNTALTDDRGQIGGVVSLGIDVSERESVKARLAGAKETAERSLSEQRQFIAMVSHEFRSPLAVIDAASQVLELRGKQSPELGDVISRLRRGVKRLSTFIDNCLAEDRIARLEKEGLKPVEDEIRLLPFLESVLDQARLNAPERVFHFRHHLCEGSVLWADPSLLRILVHNLLNNACKYSAADKPVSLEVDLGDPAQCVLRVIDEGIGIAAEDQPLLGTRLFRGRNAQTASGAGIGLFVSQRIVSLHGGQMNIISEPGKGATVEVVIPTRHGVLIHG